MEGNTYFRLKICVGLILFYWDWLQMEGLFNSKVKFLRLKATVFGLNYFSGTALHIDSEGGYLHSIYASWIYQSLPPLDVK